MAVKNISIYFYIFIILLIVTMILLIIGGKDNADEKVKIASYVFTALLVTYVVFLMVYSAKTLFSIILNTCMLPFTLTKYFCYDVPVNMYHISNGMITTKEFMRSLSFQNMFYNMAIQEQKNKQDFWNTTVNHGRNNHIIILDEFHDTKKHGHHGHHKVHTAYHDSVDVD